MKKLIAAGIACLLGLSVGGCSLLKLPEEGPQMGAQGGGGKPEEDPFAGWAMPQPGTYDETTAPEDVFSPCSDIPPAVLRELGIAIIQINTNASKGETCSTAWTREDGKKVLLVLTGNPGTYAQTMYMQETVLEKFYVDYELDGLPGAKMVRKEIDPTIQTPHCSVKAETPHGTYGFTTTTYAGIPDNEHSCDPVDHLVHRLYQMDA